MARVLKISIQVFWAIFGIYSLVGVIEIIGYRLFGHSTHSLGLVGYLFLVPMIMLLSAFACTAYVALFRFSLAVIKPTVFVASVIMFTVAMHGLNHGLLPMSDPRSHPLIAPFLDLLTLFVIIFGAFRFYRLTLAAILKMVFPSPAHLQPRSETSGKQAAFPSATWERGK